MSIRPDVSKWARQVGSFDGFPQAIREHIVAVEAEREKAEAELRECRVHCRNIDSGSPESKARSEIVHYGFTGTKAAIPKTFYLALSVPKRVEFLVQQWNRAIGVNQQLERERDEWRDKVNVSLQQYIDSEREKVELAAAFEYVSKQRDYLYELRIDPKSILAAHDAALMAEKDKQITKLEANRTRAAYWHGVADMFSIEKYGHPCNSDPDIEAWKAALDEAEGKK